MAYSIMPYVWMVPKKKYGGHIKSAQMTRSNVDTRLVKGFHGHYQALSSASMSNGTLNLLETITEVPHLQVLKRANHLSYDFLLMPVFLHWVFPVKADQALENHAHL